MRDKPSVAMTTSTPRTSDTERVFNPDSDSSQIVGDSDKEDSHKSEFNFSLTPMSINLGSSSKGKDSGPKPITGTRRLFSDSSLTEDSTVTEDKKEKDTHNSSLQSQVSSQTTYSPNESIEIAGVTSDHTSTDSSETLVVNLGPKHENKEPYRKDFYVNDTPKMQRRTPPTSPRVITQPMSPPLSPRDVKQEQDRAHTEEKASLLDISNSSVMY